LAFVGPNFLLPVVIVSNDTDTATAIGQDT
jgi:hypothetical protein